MSWIMGTDCRRALIRSKDSPDFREELDDFREELDDTDIYVRLTTVLYVSMFDSVQSPLEEWLSLLMDKNAHLEGMPGYLESFQP